MSLTVFIRNVIIKNVVSFPVYELHGISFVPMQCTRRNFSAFAFIVIKLKCVREKY